MPKAPNKLDALLLLGWMEEEDAVSFLRQECELVKPLGPDPIEEDAARQIWRQFRDRTRAVACSRTYTPAEHQILKSAAAAEFIERAGGLVKAVVAVDPAQLVAFQFYLALGRADSHAASGETWWDRCLPTERPRTALPVSREGNSLLFDVPHGEHLLMLTPGGELRIEQNDPYVKVGDLGGGRLFLRAGYHRAYAYLSAHPRPTEPFLAALTETEPIELGLPGRREKLTSASPPLVGDFLASELAMVTKTRKWRFRFRITAEMNQIPYE